MDAAAREERLFDEVSHLRAKFGSESEASYWIDFGDGQDVVQQFFPDLDLSSIVVLGAEEEEEEGGDGFPMDDGASITILASIKPAIAVVPTTSVEDKLGPSASMDLAFQLAVEVPSENEGVASIEVILLMDATLPIEAKVIPDQLLE
ncbi:hypothetical protein COCNU_07G011830 [Cocos nucifera]|uniref:Uncharacterized protein n=1 Tax=Cocos nucifera TaxID=13894 RepID=A0A8K0N5D4_COCNU|nr:hypothetical protein COCNU_07G011830 [Cocos nucifera]